MLVLIYNKLLIYISKKWTKLPHGCIDEALKTTFNKHLGYPYG